MKTWTVRAETKHEAMRRANAGEHEDGWENDNPYLMQVEAFYAYEEVDA